MLGAVNGRPAIITWWEDLHPGIQVAVAFVVSFVVLVLVHLALLNQPMGRALGYGVFWGVIATAIIVLATRTERARRIARERGDT